MGPPEEITDIHRVGVLVPQRITTYPIKVAREVLGGVWLAPSSERRLARDRRILTKRYAPATVWVELDPATRTAVWHRSVMTLPLAGVKAGMEFLR